jgi:hypothetical protein
MTRWRCHQAGDQEGVETPAGYAHSPRQCNGMAGRPRGASPARRVPHSPNLYWDVPASLSSARFGYPELLTRLHVPQRTCKFSGVLVPPKERGIIQQTLAIYEQQLGSNHPSTARSLNNFASRYQNQGK